VHQKCGRTKFNPALTRKKSISPAARKLSHSRIEFFTCSILECSAHSPRHVSKYPENPSQSRVASAWFPRRPKYSRCQFSEMTVLAYCPVAFLMVPVGVLILNPVATSPRKAGHRCTSQVGEPSYETNGAMNLKWMLEIVNYQCFSSMPNQTLGAYGTLRVQIWLASIRSEYGAN
jgi:hypothetical protein